MLNFCRGRQRGFPLTGQSDSGTDCSLMSDTWTGYFSQSVAYKYIWESSSLRWEERENGWGDWLEEVGCGRPGRYDALGVGDSAEQLRFLSVHVLKDHDGGDVPTAVAVVGCRPHGHQLLVKHELVAFVDQLMCSADELQVVDVNKLKHQRSENYVQVFKCGG